MELEVQACSTSSSALEEEDVSEEESDSDESLSEEDIVEDGCRETILVPKRKVR